MKEIKPDNLTRQAQEGYSKSAPQFNRGGDIYMAAEPGQGDQPPRISQKEATRIIDEATRVREQAEVGGGRESTTAGGGRDNEGDILPAPPSTSSRQEDVISREEFIRQATQDIDRLRTLEFKPILARARSASSQDIPGLYNELDIAYSKIHDPLFIQRINLQPKVGGSISPEERTRLAQIDRELSNLEQEKSRIATLLQSQIRYREDPKMGRLADSINDNYRRLGTAVEGSDERKALEEVIRQEAFDLSTILEESEDLSPENHPIPDKVLRAIGKDEFATEKFMGRLLAAYQEEDQFQVRGLYGGVNLDVFLKVNQDISPERMNRLQNLIEGSKALHNMNFIIKRSFDNFVEQSKVLLPRHFEVIGEIPGVRDVFLAYESLTNDELGIETRILEPATERIEREIRTSFKKKWAEKSLNIPGFAGREEVQEWEIDRALTYGRNLFKTSVRAAEIMAQSELSPDEEKYVSPPQKELTQLLHTFKYVVMRFKPNESRGGLEIVQEVLEEFRKKRREGGKVRIKTLGGTDVDMGTLQTIISPRGVFATWRMSRALLKEINFKDRDGKVTDVTQFFENNAKEIERIKDLTENNDGIGWGIEYRKANGRNPKGKELKEWKMARVKALFAPLLEGNTVSLGILVSGNGLTVPVELKEIIWEKIAESNPGAMAALLMRLEVDKDAKGKENLAGVEALEDILLRVGWGTLEQQNELGGGRVKQLREEISEKEKELTVLEGKESKQKGRISEGDVGRMATLREELDGLKKSYERIEEQLKALLRNDKWKILKDKIDTATRLRLTDEVRRIKDMREGKEVGAPKDPKSYLEAMSLDAQEKEVIEAISVNGKKIAGDLANIKKSTAWFLNDTPLEIIKWTNLGQFYDRETNDLANFSKAGQELLKVVAGEPFSMPAEEVIKIIRTAMGAAGDVLGLEVAQVNIEPILTQYLSMIYEFPNDRQIIKSALKHGGKRPTSRAQEITGSVDSLAVNEDTMYKLMEKAKHVGAYRGEVRDKKTGKLKFKSTIEHAEKKFKLQWYRRYIWANLRDYGPFFLVAFLIQFFKDISKDAFGGK